MALIRGARLGPYEVIEPIAAGGMGQVYRAVDRRLNRPVALKVIADTLRSRADLRERFKAEAALIAALNHPHICQLYDVGSEQDIEFLVMELVDGETLAARLARGPLPLDHAVRLAGEIADALDAAHRRGIVHRDLKPSNLMVSREGIKLLDFGVARLYTSDVAAAGAAATVTAVDARLTVSGARVGTWCYMAPEQIRGHDPDARSDVFALGAVIYEMVTGRRAFVGATHQSLVTAVLDAEPAPMLSVNSSLPASLDRIVRTCLAKDPEERWQSAGDVRRALEALSPSSAVPKDTRRSRARWIASVLALVAALALGALAATLIRRPPPEGRELQTSVQIGAGEQITLGAGAVAMSPDGATIVYEAAKGGVRQLFRRRLGDRAATAIAGTEGGRSPFFSPDGQWIGFTNGPQLLKVPLAGGAAALILKARETEYHGAWWTDRGTIVASLDSQSGLVSIPESGGALTPVTSLDASRGDEDHRWPQVLPDGGAVLFTAGTGPTEDVRIDIQDLRTGDRRELLRGSASARYVETGHLVFARRGVLMAAPFDLQRRALMGAPVEIAQGVAENLDGAPEYSFSRAGDLVFVAGPSSGPRNELTWVDRNGNTEALAMPVGTYFAPRLSPDGSRVAVTLLGGRNDVAVYDLARGTSTRLAIGRKHQPVWTPDGRRLVFAFGRPGVESLFWQSADGSGVAERLTTSDRPQLPRSWTPDGRTLAYVQHDPQTDWDIWTMSPDDSAPRPLVRSTFVEEFPRFSPDGRWLAYTSNESGRTEVYVRPYPSGTARWTVSAEGGSAPVWSRDGRQLFFRSRDGLWVADVISAGTFSASKPRLLFRLANSPIQFDVASDSDRFLIVRSEAMPAATQLQLVIGRMRRTLTETAR